MVSTSINTNLDFITVPMEEPNLGILYPVFSEIFSKALA